MMDRSIMDMAERLLQREITQEELDRLSAAPTIADAHLICNDILTREERLTTADSDADYERSRRMMLVLPKDDINLIIDVIEGRRVEAFVKGFLSGGFEIRPVSRIQHGDHPPGTEDLSNIKSNVSDDDVEITNQHRNTPPGWREEPVGDAGKSRIDESGRKPRHLQRGGSHRSQASLKMAFLQDMLESENVGMIEIEVAFAEARTEYRKTIEEDE